MSCPVSRPAREHGNCNVVFPNPAFLFRPHSHIWMVMPVVGWRIAATSEVIEEHEQVSVHKQFNFDSALEEFQASRLCLETGSYPSSS